MIPRKFEIIPADFSRCQFANSSSRPEERNLCSLQNGGSEKPLLLVNLEPGKIVDFSGLIFPGPVRFDHSYFSIEVTFRGTVFNRPVFFNETKFYKRSTFRSTQFEKPTFFDKTLFSSSSVFVGANFLSEASFDEAAFEDNANFDSALFSGPTRFRDAKFGTANKGSDALFYAIKVTGAFNVTGAQFSKVPGFNQADFGQAPDMDNVRYPYPPFLSLGLRGCKDPKKMSEAAKYRHLRRLAILGHDHENEAKAFKGETRAKRGTDHKPWHAAYWFGIGYDTLSDFGRSIMRPFYAWTVLTILFAGVYLRDAGHEVATWQSGCTSFLDSSRLSKALSLSFGNGLPVVVASRSDEIKAINTCLYGAADDKGVFHIPAWTPFFQLLQNLLSVFLIFLFLLGIRNQFRIK